MLIFNSYHDYIITTIKYVGLRLFAYYPISGQLCAYLYFHVKFSIRSSMRMRCFMNTFHSSPQYLKASLRFQLQWLLRYRWKDSSFKDFLVTLGDSQPLKASGFQFLPPVKKIMRSLLYCSKLSVILHCSGPLNSFSFRNVALKVF